MSDNTVPAFELLKVSQHFAELDRAIQRAIGAGIWPKTDQIQQGTQSFRDLIAYGICIQASSEADRDLALREAVERLTDLTDSLGIDLDRTPIAAKRLAVADQRDRREVWSALLDAEARYTRWPEPIRRYFLTEVVAAEADQIEAELAQVWKESGEDLASWTWDPAGAAAVYEGGWRGPVRPPAIEGMLSDAFEATRGDLAACERQAVTRWMEDQTAHVRSRGWVTRHTEHRRQLDPTWTIDHPRQRLHLRTPPLGWIEWDDHAVARVCELATDLGPLTSTPTSPTAVAFPAQVAEAAGGLDPEPPASAPTEGPVR